MPAQTVPVSDPKKTLRVNIRTKDVTINVSNAPTSRRTLSTLTFAESAALDAIVTIAMDDSIINITVNIPSWLTNFETTSMGRLHSA